MSAGIIGGGAAGLAAACMLARAGVKTAVYEKQPRVGRKLLSTGNGRCNMTNLNMSPEYYLGDARTALGAFSAQDAIAFFEDLGVSCISDAEGRVYPASNMAAGVLDALRLGAVEAGAELICDFEAREIAPERGGFCIIAADGRRAHASRLLIACGGLAAPKLGAGPDGYRLLQRFGHALVPRYPAIAPVRVEPAAVRGLKGIRARGEISLMAGDRCVRCEAGEMLFNEDNVSGICAMQLAAQVNVRRGQKLSLRVNLLPGAKGDEMLKRRALLPERALEDFLSGLMPRRLGQTLLRAAELGPMNLPARALSDADCARLQACLTGWTLPVTGTAGFEQAQVTLGGARMDEFNPDTLESKRQRELFAAGETLDVSGDCGVYNLHWAWASAALAAREIIRREK